MKKIFLIAALFASVILFGQNYQGDYLEARKSLKLRNNRIDSLIKDTSGIAARDNAVMSAAAVYKLFKGNSGWGLYGNEINDTSKFIGTTNTIANKFKAGGKISGLIEYAEPLAPFYVRGTGGASVHLGSHAGENYHTSVGTNGSNTFLGTYAGRFTRSGANTFVGFHAGYTHTYGGAFGGRNVAVGNWAFNNGYNSYDNTAVGTFSLNNLFTGISNVGLGRDAMKSLSNGDGNISVGAYSLPNIATGISGVTITNGGSGYTTATVTFSAPHFGPNGGNCTQTATGTAVLSSGSVIGVTITNPGCGYIATDTVINFDQLGLSFNWINPATVTITGDGTGATATPIMVKPEGNIGIGGYSGFYDRFTRYNTTVGVNAYTANWRYYDQYNSFFGTGAAVDIGVPSATVIEKSTAIGYNSRVGKSNALVLGGTGADAVSVGIGTISPNYPLEVVGTSGALIDSVTIDLKGFYGVATTSGDSSYINIQTSTFVGNKAGRFNTGLFNTGFGTLAMGNKASTMNHTTAVGAFALSNITTTGNFGNTATGSWSAKDFNSGANNSFYGALSGYKVRFTGTNGVATRGITSIGAWSMSGSDSSGEYHTVVGMGSGSAIKGGSFNTGIGALVFGAGNTQVGGGTPAFTGNNNLAAGNTSMFSPTTAVANVALGSETGRYITSGSYNVLAGYQAGRDITTGSYNVIIGGNNGSSIATFSNRIIFADGQGNIRQQFDNNGKATFSGYGIGSQTGTATYNAAFDASGNLIEVASRVNAGTYTPSLTNVTNVAASTAYPWKWSRVDSLYTISGEVDIDPTSAATLTQLGVSLPPVISGVLSATYDASGTAADDLGTSARVIADASNQRIQIRLTPTDVSNRRFSVIVHLIVFAP